MTVLEWSEESRKSFEGKIVKNGEIIRKVEGRFANKGEKVFCIRIVNWPHGVGFWRLYFRKIGIQLGLKEPKWPTTVSRNFLFNKGE